MAHGSDDILHSEGTKMIIEEKIIEGETTVLAMEDMSAESIVIQRGNIVVEAGVVV